MLKIMFCFYRLLIFYKSQPGCCLNSFLLVFNDRISDNDNVFDCLDSVLFSISRDTFHLSGVWEHGRKET